MVHFILTFEKKIDIIMSAIQINKAQSGVTKKGWGKLRTKFVISSALSVYTPVVGQG